MSTGTALRNQDFISVSLCASCRASIMTTKFASPTFVQTEAWYALLWTGS